MKYQKIAIWRVFRPKMNFFTRTFSTHPYPLSPPHASVDIIFWKNRSKGIRRSRR
jgi:hypothetical protein